jgi:hypothetical protein
VCNQEGARIAPSDFFTDTEAYDMKHEFAKKSRSRNEFRELALAVSLLMLLLVTVI